MNLKVRMKNPWFWIGIVGVALTAIGVDPQTFTSWAAVFEGIKNILGNPVQLVTLAFSILAVFVDPTTAGVRDSKKAMTYTEPKKEVE